MPYPNVVWISVNNLTNMARHHRLSEQKLTAQTLQINELQTKRHQPLKYAMYLQRHAVVNHVWPMSNANRFPEICCSYQCLSSSIFRMLQHILHYAINPLVRQKGHDAELQPLLPRAHYKLALDWGPAID